MKTNALKRTQKTLTVLEYILIVVIMLGCKSEPKKELNTDPVPKELKGSISISGADALYPLMKIWAEEFSVDNPNLKITVSNVGSEKGLDALLSGHADLAMVSRNLTPEEEAKGLWYLVVSKEGIIPIINEKNPYLQKIQSQGIDRMTLIELFTTNNKVHWGNIFGITNNDPVKKFIRSDFSDTAEVWSEYLGVDQKDLIGMPLTSDELIIEAVSQEPLSLSFCNAHSAYNLKKGEIRKGIKILPIDFNCNGKIDSKERFYKNLCMMQRAAYLGKYPSHLCRELYLVSIGKPLNQATLEFLKWIYTRGQKLAAKAGYAEIRNCQVKELINHLNTLEQNNE